MMQHDTVNGEIIDTYSRPEKVVPYDRWRPKRCALRSADGDENTAMAEKVDYLEHASLVHPSSGLVKMVGRADDVGSLFEGRNNIKI